MQGEAVVPDQAVLQKRLAEAEAARDAALRGAEALKKQAEGLSTEYARLHGQSGPDPWIMARAPWLAAAPKASAPTHYSRLTAHDSLLTTHYSPLTTHYSRLTTHYSTLTTHHAPLTTHHVPGAAAAGEGESREQARRLRPRHGRRGQEVQVSSTTRTMDPYPS